MIAYEVDGNSTTFFLKVFKELLCSLVGWFIRCYGGVDRSILIIKEGIWNHYFIKGGVSFLCPLTE